MARCIKMHDYLQGLLLLDPCLLMMSNACPHFSFMGRKLLSSASLMVIESKFIRMEQIYISSQGKFMLRALTNINLIFLFRLGTLCPRRISAPLHSLFFVLFLSLKSRASQEMLYCYVILFYFTCFLGRDVCPYVLFLS